MAQAFATRATSLAASSALLAVAGFLALSFSWTVSHWQPPSDRPVVVSETEPATPPTPPHPVPHVRRSNPTPGDEAAVDNVKATPVSDTANGAGPATPDPGPPTIANAHWLQTPRDLARYYPVMALRRGIEGDVQLDCLVTTTGALQCAVASETPANWGFAAAALRISQDYRMAPAMRDGAPVEARYRLRVPFRLNR
jgi:protein TonB